jgi:hypothetical protein
MSANGHVDGVGGSGQSLGGGVVGRKQDADDATGEERCDDKDNWRWAGLESQGLSDRRRASRFDGSSLGGANFPGLNPSAQGFGDMWRPADNPWHGGRSAIRYCVAVQRS